MNKLLLLGLGGLGLLALASKSSAQEASRANTPLQVVENLLKGVGNPEGQVLWLRDHGFPKTSAALSKFNAGEISAEALILTATNEGLA